MKIGKVTRYDEPRPVRLDVEIPLNNLPIVLIRQEAVWEMWSHATEGMPNEIGGYLIGFPVKDVKTGNEATYIEKAVRAISNSTPTHITMHPESFREVEREREQSDTILVGYYHSHPGLGIFLSGTDVTNFRSYHPESYQIAVVVDQSKTTPDHLDVRSEWIGFFGWDRTSPIIRLPEENVSVVDNRPEVIYKSESKPRLSLETEIADAIWQATDMLRRGSHKFNPETPIVIISQDVIEQLLQKNPSLPNEGLLFGAGGYIAGYDFICVDKFRPLALEEPREHNEFIQRLARKFQGSSMQSYVVLKGQKEAFYGRYPVGFYCTESKLSKIDMRRLPRLFTKLAINRDFTSSCREYCLIAVKDTDGEEGRVDFKVWCNGEKRLIELPESQLVFKPCPKACPEARGKRGKGGGNGEI